MKHHDTGLCRRSFLKSTAALAATTLAPNLALAASSDKPDSKVNGVQIGTITYSFRSLPGSAEDLLKYITKCGISSIELMGDPVEQYAGAPSRRRGGNEALSEWRRSAPMEKFQGLGQLYKDAGVDIHIVKFGDIGNPGMSDDVIEYYFKAAKALGARGITRELSEPAAKRLGPLADKHGIMVGMHNHTQITPTTYDGDLLSHGDLLRINLDIGHYTAGTGQSPVPFIEKHHDRIISLHVKDRKINNGPNMPFGQGDTPIAEVLQLMRKHTLTFPADIELEYKVPDGSDAVKEVAKCVQFCKEALA